MRACQIGGIGGTKCFGEFAPIWPLSIILDRRVHSKLHGHRPCAARAALLKSPRRMRFRVISAKKRSTMLSQDAEVGVKRRWKRGCALSQRFTAGVLWVA